MVSVITEQGDLGLGVTPVTEDLNVDFDEDEKEEKDDK